jgi:hypothetical protein
MKFRERTQVIWNIVNPSGCKLFCTFGERKSVNGVFRTHHTYLKDCNGTQCHACSMDFISTLQQIVIYSVIPCCYLSRFIWQFLLLFSISCLHYCYLLRYILPLIFAACGFMFWHSLLYAIIYSAIRCYFVLCYIVSFINLGTIIPLYLSNQYRL